MPKAAMRAIDKLVANAILIVSGNIVSGICVAPIAMQPQRVEPRITLRGWAAALSPKLNCNVVRAPNGPKGKA